MNVFFYGLFMDRNLLATKGVEPLEANVGFVDGYELRIGERATLLQCPRGRAYGVVMEITAREATELYSEPSVADYEPEPVVVELLDGSMVNAACYNLPEEKVAGANEDYARALLELASELNFPDNYLDQIRQS